MNQRMLRRMVILAIVILPVVLVMSGWLTFFKLFAGRMSPPARTAASFYDLISQGDYDRVGRLLVSGQAWIREGQESRVVTFAGVQGEQRRLPTVSYFLRDLAGGQVLADEGLYPRFRTAGDVVAVSTSKGVLYVQHTHGRWYVRYLWRPRLGAPGR